MTRLNVIKNRRLFFHETKKRKENGIEIENESWQKKSKSVGTWKGKEEDCHFVKV